MWPAGTARAPVRGDVGLEGYVAGYRGGNEGGYAALHLYVTPDGADLEVMQRPPAGTIPDAPGSYQFKDADGRVIYVGKAKSLRSRVGSYFQNPVHLQPRTAQMVASAASVEWIQVRNDVEAVML